MIKKAKKAIKSKDMPKSLEKRFIENGMSDLLEDVYVRTAELLQENSSVSKALYTHLE